MKKGSVVRPSVRRVIMGGCAMFDADMIKDELESSKLKIWGVLVQEESRVDPHVFAAEVGLPEGEFHCGLVRKDPPSELTKGSHWTESGYLTFGDAQAETQTHGLQLLSYVCTCMHIPYTLHMYIYICKLSIIHMCAIVLECACALWVRVNNIKVMR